MSISVLAQSDTDKWSVFDNFKYRRIYPATVRIGSNTCLIAGGYASRLWGEPTKTCEVIQIINDSIQHYSTGEMGVPRVEYPLLSSGDSVAYAIGGFQGGNAVSSIVEKYSVKTKRWTRVGSMLEGRRQHSAFWYSDTEILIVGGRDEGLSTLASAEVFDIETGTSRRIADYPNRINGSIAGVLRDGRGVICGGRAGGPDSPRSPNIYTYDISTERWEVLSKMPYGREAPMSYKAEDGRFIAVCGSIKENDPVTFIGDVVVEEDLGLSTLGVFGEGRTYAGVAEHEKGRLMVVGGWLSSLLPTNNCEVMDLTTGYVTTGPSLNYARRYTRAVTLYEANSNRRFTFAMGGVGKSDFDYIETIEVLYPKKNVPIEPCDPIRSQIDITKNSDLFILKGFAGIKEEGIDLTSTAKYATGAIWSKELFQVEKGFETRFTFRMRFGANNGQTDLGSPGADGLALVLQNKAHAPLGKPGEGIGYDDCPSGLAIEFDSYLNAAYLDPAVSHVAIQVGDNMKLRSQHNVEYNLGFTTVPDFIADGRVYHAKVNYLNGSLVVYLDQTGEFKQPILSASIPNIKTLVNTDIEGRTQIGITSATGIATQTHELLSWYLSGCNGITSIENENITSQNKDGLIVYPIRASEKCSIVFDNNSASSLRTLVIHDILGKEMVSISIPPGQSQVDISTMGWANGTYIINVVSPSSVRTTTMQVLQK